MFFSGEGRSEKSVALMGQVMSVCVWMDENCGLSTVAAQKWDFPSFWKLHLPFTFHRLNFLFKKGQVLL